MNEREIKEKYFRQKKVQKQRQDMEVYEIINLLRKGEAVLPNCNMKQCLTELRWDTYFETRDV